MYVPWDSLHGQLLGIGFSLVVIVIAAAALLSGRRKRTIPKALRDKPDGKESIRSRIERKRKKSVPLASRLASRDGSIPAGAEGSPEKAGLSEVSGGGNPARERKGRFIPPRYKRWAPSPWLSAVVLVVLALGVLIAILGFSEVMIDLGGFPLSPPLLLAAFFIGLFALEFLSFEKLKYVLFAALPVGAVVILGAFVDLLEIWPVLLVALGVAAVAVILWSMRRERSAASWQAWRKGLREVKPPGEKTARILGRSRVGRVSRRSPGTLERARESKANGIMYRIP